MNTKIFHKLSGEMAVHGTLLLIFGLLLLGLKPISEIVIFQFAPLPHDWFYNTAWGWILILIALAVVVGIYFIWHRYKLASSLKRWLKILMKSFVCLLIIFILWLIPTVPVSFFTVLWIILGIIALLASLAFMVAVLWEPWAVGIDKRIKGQQYKYAYWQIFLLVYLGSWLQGLSVIPTEGKLFGVIDWIRIHEIVYFIGFLWFIVISIVTFGDFLRSKKQTDQTK
ncbi:MAG: hypothetical protein NT134_05425 [Chloroflexi bacterium]|nr:hypothetical protein [Chloroflexota bacterium]